MNHEIVAYGVGISIIFFFFRYLVVFMPKQIAWAGVIAGLIIALADNLMPGIKLSLPSILLFVTGALFIGASVYLATKQSLSPATAQTPSAPVAQVEPAPAPPQAPGGVTITNPHGSNIVVGPTGGPVNQTIVNPDLQPATPRTLTDEQKKAIAASLAKAPPATLFVPYINSKEAIGFSSQFRQLFYARGWKFLDFSGSNRRPAPREPIMVGWRGKKSPSYLAVVQGFKDANINFFESEFELSGDQDTDIIAFDVGVIPMNDFQVSVDREE